MITLKDAKGSVKSFTKVSTYKGFEIYKDIYNHFLFWQNVDTIYSYNNYVFTENKCKTFIDKLYKGTLDNIILKTTYKICLTTKYQPIKLFEILS